MFPSQLHALNTSVSFSIVASKMLQFPLIFEQSFSSLLCFTKKFHWVYSSCFQFRPCHSLSLKIGFCLIPTWGHSQYSLLLIIKYNSFLSPHVHPKHYWQTIFCHYEILSSIGSFYIFVGVFCLFVFFLQLFVSFLFLLLSFNLHCPSSLFIGFPFNTLVIFL